MVCEAKFEIWKQGEIFLCQECDQDRQEEMKQINKLQKQGHSHHCACRQVWGDGECECDLYKQGYDPYKWIKNPTISSTRAGAKCRASSGHCGS
jgi:hypothetical protein